MSSCGSTGASKIHTHPLLRDALITKAPDVEVRGDDYGDCDEETDHHGTIANPGDGTGRM